MAATIELKYYNSFWIKKIKEITDVAPGTEVVATTATATTTIEVGAAGTADLKRGLLVKNLTTPFTKSNIYITEITSGTTFEVSEAVDVNSGNVLSFGPFINFDNIPKEYSATPAEDWYIEEARIRGGYNNTTVDFGVKAYAVDDSKEAETRKNTLIYSGIYNSRTGVNNTNQFSVGQDITKSVDPAYGSIQKLYAEDTNLVIFQEDKVSRALIDKDAIYSAEGGGTITSTNLVIGQIVPYGGEYGISTEPESFAVYGYRKYFSDRKRNAVLRLSRDGIEEISRYGMTDFWRDELSSMSPAAKIIGGYDLHTKKYDISILKDGQFTDVTPQNDNYETLAFDESVKGWTSFYTYAPDYILSLKNNFYSIKNGKIYKHYNGANRGKFYNYTTAANVTFIFNPNVSLVKNFKTINYEGSRGWVVSEITTNQDTGNYIGYYSLDTTQSQLENRLLASNFKRKEDKYFANITNATPQNNNEIVFGKSMTGLKGFFATVKMTVEENPEQSKELFAVSTEYVQSSY